jgi:hypothetical protein
MTPLIALAFGAGVKGLLILVATLAGFAIFGTVAVASHPQPLVPSSSPDQDTVLGQAHNLLSQFEILTGTTDAIVGGGGSLNSLPGAGTGVPICGISFIESSVVDATTLATPIAGDPAAGGNDGLTITIVDNGGHAHTVTTASNVITPAHHLATFNGTQGSFVTFVARNGKWIPLAVSGVTIT